MKLTKRLIVGVAISLGISTFVAGCSQQSMTRDMGASTTIELEPNVKLEEITWKDNSLWYLTRPMREDDIAETHTFQEESEFGVLEGTVTIIETKQ